MSTRPDLAAGGLAVLREILRLPRVPAWAATPEQRQRLLEEEAAVRDDLVDYAYAYDSADIDAVMAHFSDDVVIANPRGRFTGSALIRKNYEFLYSQWSRQRHMWQNVAVRFVDSPDEAYRTAYIYGLLTSASKNFVAVGTDIHHLRKIDGRWKIVERCITDDVSHPIEPFGGPLEDTRTVPRPVGSGAPS
jgi:ketosteroid isomerase-like protein